MTKKRAISALILLYTLLLNVWSQTTGEELKATISGTITDENHQPLEIVTITVLGEPGGTMSDLQGKYSLTINSKDRITLVYSII